MHSLFSDTVLAERKTRKKDVICQMCTNVPSNIALADCTVHFILQGELMGYLADPDCRFYGGETRSLLIFSTCGKMLLEYGQLQCCNGVFGRAKVLATLFLKWLFSDRLHCNFC